jgi:hypothetical protein
MRGAVAGLVLLGGCYDLSGLGGASDMASPDLPPPPPDSAGNLLANGDFESGLAPWMGNFSTVSWSSEGHTGAHSAEICTQGATLSNFYADVTLSASTAYRLDAWVKLEAPAVVEATAVLFVYGPMPNLEPNTSAANQSGWQPVTVLFAGDPAANRGEIDYEGRVLDADGGTTCFLLDDVVLSTQ